MKHHVWVPLVLLCAAACSSRSESGAAPAEDAIPECDAYVATLTACLTRAGSQVSEATTEARTAMQARFAAAARDGAARERVRAKCASGLKAIAASCP